MDHAEGPCHTVSFDARSQGQLAMVIYEWGDNEMLGKITSMEDDTLPVRLAVLSPVDAL